MRQEPTNYDPTAYVTVLSTDNYLDGVLVLNESLRMCRAKYRLYALVGSEVSNNVRDTLARVRIEQIDAPPINVPVEIKQANVASDHHRHWAGVFEKLGVFSLCQFEKIVYIDSDVLVIKNLDELFDRPPRSAVIADRYPGNEDCTDLNAGLMVIEPEPTLTNQLAAFLPEAFEHEKRWRAAVGRPPSMGVQSVINLFWKDWITTPELHLDGRYNVLVEHLDDYMRQEDHKWRGPEGIHVLHFIGQVKPWMLTPANLSRRVAQLAIRRRIWELTGLMAYRAVLLRVRFQLRSSELRS